jgi:hypothetical protein
MPATAMPSAATSIPTVMSGRSENRSVSHPNTGWKTLDSEVTASVSPATAA